MTGYYAVATDSTLGFAFYREYRLAKMRALCEGSEVVYFTCADFDEHMARWAGVRA